MAFQVALSREPDDPIALRASIGGNDKIGYYLKFRGDPEQVVKMLEEMTFVAKTALLNGHYQDMRGRPQG